MKRYIILIPLTVLSLIAGAQNTQDSIKAVINNLFEGMKNGDAFLLQSAFADSAILQTISKNEDGKIKVQNESVNDFAEFVSKLAKGSADEQISFEMIKIDGPMAMVWAPYSFYFNGVFSHCGVDLFTMVRFNDQWKIQYLIDTRRKKGCQY